MEEASISIQDFIHFLCDLTKDGTIKLVYCKNEEQIVNILTKPLKTETFLKLRALLKMHSNVN